MTTLCCFCNAIITPEKSPGEPINHGVCTPCYNRIYSEFGLNVKKFLNMMDAPVFLVDGKANILEANTHALKITGKSSHQVRGVVCGRVLDCINACLHEGCGKTENCPECVIRNAINSTYGTGEPVNNARAIVRRSEDIRNKDITVRVSTKKAGEIILLMLEPFESP